MVDSDFISIQPVCAWFGPVYSFMGDFIVRDVLDFLACESLKQADSHKTGSITVINSFGPLRHFS
jgi:hypothetical protein